MSRRLAGQAPDGGRKSKRARKSNSNSLEAFTASQTAVTHKEQSKKRRRAHTITENQVEDTGDGPADQMWIKNLRPQMSQSQSPIQLQLPDQLHDKELIISSGVKAGTAYLISDKVSSFNLVYKKRQ